MSAFISMLKEEEKALSERRKSIEGRVDSLKKYILSNMEAGEKVNDAQAQIGTRKSEAVEILNEMLIPKELCNHVPESWRVDKAAIKKAIKSGKDIEGAKVVQRLNLTVK